MTDCIPQLVFSFYRHQPIRADFSGGQITSDAGLLPLRAFDQHHHVTHDLAQLLSDPREDDRVRHDSLTLLRQRIYQIIAGYEDANDADRLRHDPMLQIVADQKLGEALGSQPTLSRWENAPSPRDLVRLNDALLEIFIRVCGDQVQGRGEILLDIDSTDDPTHGQQQLSFFNGAYGQHMYHPMLVFERHTGCLLAARLRPGNASSHARIVPMLLRLVPRLQTAFPNIKIKLRGDAGFALPLLYEFCEFFDIQYALGIPANQVFQRRAESRQKQLKRRYRRTQLPSAASPAFAIAPAPGRTSAASATRPSTPPPAPSCVSSSPTVPVLPPPFLLSTTIAENARTASRSSRTAFAPTALVATASWPTPSGCSCTASPTTWSTCFVFSCRSPGARHRSKRCAHASSNSEPGCARPLVASASTWPPVGIFNLSSATQRWPSTPASPLRFTQPVTTSSPGGALPEKPHPVRSAGFRPVPSHPSPPATRKNRCGLPNSQLS